MEIDEDLFSHPRRFVKAGGEVNRHNGGDKRCPACGGYCKKRVLVSYYCPPCGIEFDSNMNVIDHPEAAPAPAPVEETAPVEVPVQDELVEEQVNVPIPFPRRPWACHCGIAHYWKDIHGKPHCTNCEMEYRSYAI